MRAAACGPLRYSNKPNFAVVVGAQSRCSFGLSLESRRVAVDDVRHTALVQSVDVVGAARMEPIAVQFARQRFEEKRKQVKTAKIVLCSSISHTKNKKNYV